MKGGKKERGKRLEGKEKGTQGEMEERRTGGTEGRMAEKYGTYLRRRLEEMKLWRKEHFGTNEEGGKG